jgi:hypothetical protein
MVKIVSSFMQVAKNLQESSEKTNSLKVLLKKKMPLLIKELSEME